MTLLAAGPFGLGGPEILIIAFVIVLLFGAGRVSGLAGELGKGIREFRKATKDDADDNASSKSDAADAGADVAFCTECGGRNKRGVKFCAECGHAMGAAVS